MAKRNAGGSPLNDGQLPVKQVGLPLDCAHPEPSHRHPLPPLGPRPAPSAAARPSNLTGALRDENRPSVRGTASFQSNLERYTMSTTDQATPSHSIKNERREAASPSSGPSKAGRQQPRTVRLTVSLPGDLVDRLRDAVYWSPSLTLAWLVAQSLRTSLTEMESLRQCPFPKRTKALRAGRPRLVGQTMNVSSRARLTGNGTARQAEGITQATLAHIRPSSDGT